LGYANDMIGECKVLRGLIPKSLTSSLSSSWCVPQLSLV